jgi:hypothetical protein
MHDFIEHAYYPVQNIRKAYQALNSGGVIYITTFHIECRNMKEKRGGWNMLWWNHVHHFSLDMLFKILSGIGFELVSARAVFNSQHIVIIARKS